MDLEKLKSALDGQKFGGYLFERPVRQITLDVQRKARQMESSYRTKDLQVIFITLAAAVVCQNLIRQYWNGFPPVERPPTS